MKPIDWVEASDGPFFYMPLNTDAELMEFFGIFTDLG